MWGTLGAFWNGLSEALGRPSGPPTAEITLGMTNFPERGTSSFQGGTNFGPGTKDQSDPNPIDAWPKRSSRAVFGRLDLPFLVTDYKYLLTTSNIEVIYKRDRTKTDNIKEHIQVEYLYISAIWRS